MTRARHLASLFVVLGPIDSSRWPDSLMAMTIRGKWAMGLAAGCSVAAGAAVVRGVPRGLRRARPTRRCSPPFYNLTYARTTAIASMRPRPSSSSLCDPSRFAYLALLPVLVALRSSAGAATACAVVVLVVRGGRHDAGAQARASAAPRLASFLGIVSPVPDPRFPSGHSTAAMALVLALTFVAPARLRPVVAGLGAVFAAAVGYSLLTIGSHFPATCSAAFSSRRPGRC